MPDKPAPPCLTLEIEHTDDVTIVRCHGQLVSELSKSLYRFWQGTNEFCSVSP